MTRRRSTRLRALLGRIRLTPSSRGIVLALLKFGGPIDLRFLLGRIERAQERIDFWNHIELCHAVAKNFARSGRRLPHWLNRVQRKDEFWQYMVREERSVRSSAELLPLDCTDNRALYIRIAAYGIIGSAHRQDEEILMRLAHHEYELIARDSAIRLVRVLGQPALRKLSASVDESIREGRSSALAAALRSAEIEAYSVAEFW